MYSERISIFEDHELIEITLEDVGWSKLVMYLKVITVDPGISIGVAFGGLPKLIYNSWMNTYGGRYSPCAGGIMFAIGFFVYGLRSALTTCMSTSL